MIVEETRRRIIENDFPAFRKAAELKKQKMSLQWVQLKLFKRYDTA